MHESYPQRLWLSWAYLWPGCGLWIRFLGDSNAQISLGTTNKIAFAFLKEHPNSGVLHLATH